MTRNYTIIFLLFLSCCFSRCTSNGTFQTLVTNIVTTEQIVKIEKTILGALEDNKLAIEELCAIIDYNNDSHFDPMNDFSREHNRLLYQIANYAKEGKPVTEKEFLYTLQNLNKEIVSFTELLLLNQSRDINPIVYAITKDFLIKTGTTLLRNQYAKILVHQYQVKTVEQR